MQWSSESSVHRFSMAEHISNHQDPSGHLDKENQSHSLEKNQTNETSMIRTPLQVSGSLSVRGTNNSDWLRKAGKRKEEKEKVCFHDGSIYIKRSTRRLGISVKLIQETPVI
ncbi:uncharacterized protein ACNLHF_015354 [Anomaloglossus baeobatrachus]